MIGVVAWALAVFFAALLGVGLALKATAPFRRARRRKNAVEFVGALGDRMSRAQYREALAMMDKGAGWWGAVCNLPVDAARQLTEMRLQCLERTGQTQEALLSLSSYLAREGAEGEDRGAWLANLYERWIRLYQSLPPLPVEQFYGCPDTGLRPDMKALLESAIKRGCQPPVGYPGISYPFMES